MKAIKLIAIFAGILGAVVLAFLLPSKCSSERELAHIPDSTYIYYSKLFEDRWAEANDWQESIFKQNVADVEELSKKMTVDQLREKNSTLAINLVDSLIFAEWRAASCRKSVIDKYAGAIKTIVGSDHTAATDDRVIKINRVYNVYKDARDLATSTISLKPQFNGANSTWNNYKQYADNKRSIKNRVLNNDDYKTYLSNISEIKNGLNSLDNRLDDGRTKFYKNLAGSIISYYKYKTANDDNLSNLKNVRRKYENEYRSNDNLDRFVEEYTRQNRNLNNAPEHEHER